LDSNLKVRNLFALRFAFANELLCGKGFLRFVVPLMVGKKFLIYNTNKLITK